MRIPDLDKILSAMLKTYDGISDLNFSVGHPLQVEDFGELKPVSVDPPIEALTAYQTEQIALTLMQRDRRLIHDYREKFQALKDFISPPFYAKLPRKRRASSW